MKKSIGLVVLAFAVFMCNCNTAYSWSFTLKNMSKITLSCDVYGEHLFWRDVVDCSVNDVGPDNGKICYLPGAICPVAISCKYNTRKLGEVVSCNTGWWRIGLQCMDSYIEINQDIYGRLHFDLNRQGLIPPVSTDCVWYR